MKIATMVRGILPTPRPVDIMYSPLNVAVTICEQLTKQGHSITYYGTGVGPKVSEVRQSDLRPVVQDNHDWQALLNSADLFTHYLPSLYDQALIQDMFKRANDGEFDLLHFHHPESALAYARVYPQVPVVYTLHDQLDTQRREILESFASPNQHFISISNNQRRGAPDLNYAATVYNGIDTAMFKPNGGAEDYLLFVGRIVPDKGVKEAVQVAQKTGLRLLIIGQVQDADRWYFDTHIKPHLNDKILYLGLIEPKHIVPYFQKARALLVPIQWEEPFGLGMVEAMACGTPVIAMHRGSVPEIVVEGRTGYIVESIAEMVTAVGKLDTINRADCYNHVRKHFSTERMIKGYEIVFEQVIATSGRGRLQRNLVGTVRRATKPLTQPVETAKIVKKKIKQAASKAIRQNSDWKR